MNTGTLTPIIHHIYLLLVELGGSDKSLALGLFNWTKNNTNTEVTKAKPT
jgi:hypothetical protein